MENLEEFYKKIRKLVTFYYKKKHNTKGIFSEHNETYPCMKRKAIYAPTNNITLNVLQKSSKIQSIVCRICFEMIGFPPKGNYHC
jgi:formylmethanofuran dehydrogenase subunit E